MEEAFAPFTALESFRSLFTSFENPIIGILTGLVLTAIIQSSSASVGILQALSATGVVTWQIAIPMIIGQNIGKCMTIVLGSIGANKNAKRVSLSYVLFNIFGALAFCAIIYGIYYTIGIEWFADTVNRGDIANFHLIFNLLTSILLLPFVVRLDRLTGKILGKEEKNLNVDKIQLDPLLFKTPTIALEQSEKLLHKMGDLVLDNYHYMQKLFNKFDAKILTKLEENESFLDKGETALSEYILKIPQKTFNPEQKRLVGKILNSIGDFERIGDHCVGISHVLQERHEQKFHFSPEAQKELESMIKADEKLIESTVLAFITNDGALAMKVEPLAEIVEKLKEIIKNHHVERLQKGVCTIENGISLLEILTHLDRVASHCSNIALHIIKCTGMNADFDEMHGHANDRFSEDYQAFYHLYESRFISPLLSNKTHKKL
ncbi:Na/Pi cotransporter family protein [bacterium]|nr:Na/Pi cotransporter family protein [bacterium]